MKFLINALKNWVGDDESAASLKTIVGTSREIMVYGLSSCYWQEIVEDCKRQNYTVYMYDNFPTATLLYEGKGLARICKAQLTSLIIENAKRIAVGKDIIPLLFVVASDTKEISIDAVATTHGRGIGNVTNQEMRRLYKLSKETTPEIQALVALTLKPVKVRLKTHHGFTFYVFEQVPPLWQTAKFQKLWRKRRHLHCKEKKLPWNEILTHEIQRLTSHSRLFSSLSPKGFDSDQLLTEKDNKFKNEVSNNTYLQKFFKDPAKVVKTEEVTPPNEACSLRD